jgi:Domain of unknown function (DUF1906)
MPPLEGVDYSHHPANSPGSAALKAAGKHFAVRYVVGQDDPRGITTAECAELLAGGVDVVAVYEGTANRMLDGEPAGEYDAMRAHAFLIEVGLPATMPIFFACDFDASTQSELAAIRGYLRGAASMLTLGRTGVYGGYTVIQDCYSMGAASLYWMTSAWDYGRGVHPAACLYQYAYNVMINGTNCDATQALMENYGQATRYLAPPTTTSTTTTTTPSPYAKVSKPNWWAHGMETKTDQHENATTWWWLGERIFTTIDRTNLFCRPTSNNDSYKSGPTLDAGVKVRALFGGECEDGIDYIYLAKDDALKIPEGAVIRANSVTPKVTFKTRPDRAA